MMNLTDSKHSRLLRAVFTLALAATATALLGCASSGSPPTTTGRVTPQLVGEIAPGGKLRAAINLGNPILATANLGGGAPIGVSVDLAHELGKRLGVPVELVTFTSAGRVVEAVTAAQVDIAFVAVDPVRGAGMGQTPPYVVIEGAYLVKYDSSIRSNAEVDRANNRVIVATGSAYDLFLSRELKAARLVRTTTSQEVANAMLAQNIEVAAGVRQQMLMDATRLNNGQPTVRLLDGRFMVINQAMGLPKGRTIALDYLNAFIEDMKASGFVAQALARHNIDGAAVAPAAGR